MGDIIEIAGGRIIDTAKHDIIHKSGGDIISSAAKCVRNVGEEQGVIYGEPELDDLYEQDPQQDLEILMIDGPFDVVTGERLTNGISRFQEYHYTVLLNKSINNAFDIYWGQSVGSSTTIIPILNSTGRPLRGGTVLPDGKTVRVKMRFGQGDEGFKLHAYLYNRYYESTSLEVGYNKVVGIVNEGDTESGIVSIEIFEVGGTAYTPHKQVVDEIQAELGGEANDALALFYDIKAPINIILDGISGAAPEMKKTGGSFSWGSKKKPFRPKYYEKVYKNLDGFRGNQYTKVSQLTKVGRTFGKFGNVGTIVIGGIDIAVNYKKEDGFGTETQQAVGSLVGNLAGAELGAVIGATIGAAFGGVGAIPGGIIGAVIVGYLGGEAGETTVEYIQKQLQ